MFFNCVCIDNGTYVPILVLFMIPMVQFVLWILYMFKDILVLFLVLESSTDSG